MVKEEREDSSGESESEEEVNRINRDHGWPGTSTRTKGRSVWRIAMWYHDVEDLGVSDSDSDVYAHFKGTRQGREQQGRDIVVGSNFEGTRNQVQVQDDSGVKTPRSSSELRRFDSFSSSPSL